MQVFSAPDAITPAYHRTKDFLFKPFKWSTYLKLCLVALITDGSSGSFNSGSNWHGGHSSSHVPSMPFSFHITPGMIWAVIFMGLLILFIGLVISYLITRLRFAFFHCLVHNIREIRPGWGHYRSAATRFFWMTVVIGLCFLLIVVLVALPFVGGFWKLLGSTAAGSHPDIGQLLALILPLIPIILLLVLAGFLLDIILRDFMLPHFALDDASAGQAWAATWTKIKREKGAFAVYALFRLILPIAAGIAIFVVMILPGIIFGLIVVGVEVGIHSAVTGGPAAVEVVGIFFQVMIGIIAAAVAIVAFLALCGPVSTGMREYALLFYGGRYPRLGDILYPPQAIIPSAQGTF
jgi:hypothetical protein